MSFLLLRGSHVENHSKETDIDLSFDIPEIPDVDTHPCYHLSIQSPTEACVPSVICPGVQKSGTTFLYYSLIKHPSIAASSIKEVNYFIDNPGSGKFYTKGIEAYAAHFVANESKMLVDFSPKYMMTPESAELIYQTNRNAKFVILLRNPVDRAYSQFQYMNKLFYLPSHIDKTLHSECPRRKEEVTFKHVLAEEFRVLRDCGMLPWNPDPVKFVFSNVQLS